MKKIYILCLLTFVVQWAFAQAPSAEPVEMADLLRSSGKIYVVIGTISVVFIGLAIYLFSIDKRLSKLEKEHK
ncbi:MAG: CcmD family protein [Sphingobacteriaceae bacterium]|jgi:CcmD family protein